MGPGTLLNVAPKRIADRSSKLPSGSDPNTGLAVSSVPSERNLIRNREHLWLLWLTSIDFLWVRGSSFGRFLFKTQVDVSHDVSFDLPVTCEAVRNELRCGQASIGVQRGLVLVFFFKIRSLGLVESQTYQEKMMMWNYELFFSRSKFKSFCSWRKSDKSSHWQYGLHQLRLAVFQHHLQGFIHPRWLAGFLPSIVSSSPNAKDFQGASYGSSYGSWFQGSQVVSVVHRLQNWMKLRLILIDQNPRKATWQWKHINQFEGVSPSTNGDVPACHVSFRGFSSGKSPGETNFWASTSQIFPNSQVFHHQGQRLRSLDDLEKDDFRLVWKLMVIQKWFMWRWWIREKHQQHFHGNHELIWNLCFFNTPPPIAKGSISTQIRRLILRILRDSHDGKEGVVLLDSHDVFCCTLSFWRQAIHTGTLRSYDAKKVDPGECWVLRWDSRDDFLWVTISVDGMWVSQLLKVVMSNNSPY